MLLSMLAEYLAAGFCGLPRGSTYITYQQVGQDVCLHHCQNQIFDKYIIYTKYWETIALLGPREKVVPDIKKQKQHIFKNPRSMRKKYKINFQN